MNGTGSVSPAGDKHPGQIVYEDRVEKRTWTAAEVPPEIAWVKVDDAWRPVVRIAAVGAPADVGRGPTGAGPDADPTPTPSTKP